MSLFSWPWIYAGLLSRLFSAHQSCGFTSGQAIFLRHQAFFFGIVEDAVSLQKTFKKRESSKLPQHWIVNYMPYFESGIKQSLRLLAYPCQNPVFNCSFTVKWRFCAPFLSLTWSDPSKQKLASSLPMSPGKQCTDFLFTNFDIIYPSLFLQTVAPIHRPGFNKPIEFSKLILFEFSKLILYYYFYYISYPEVHIYRVFQLGFYINYITLYFHLIPSVLPASSYHQNFP